MARPRREVAVLIIEDLHEREDVMSAPVPAPGDRLLTASEVAELFRVDPKTVTRWARAGKLTSVRTPGGRRRFRLVEVRAFLTEAADAADAADAAEDTDEAEDADEAEDRDADDADDGRTGDGDEATDRRGSDARAAHPATPSSAPR
jgi:excisionase family DNA binding protein